MHVEQQIRICNVYVISLFCVARQEHSYCDVAEICAVSTTRGEEAVEGRRLRVSCSGTSKFKAAQSGPRP